MKARYIKSHGFRMGLCMELVLGSRALMSSWFWNSCGNVLSESWEVVEEFLREVVLR